MKQIMSFLKLADAYERKARLSPAVVTILPALVLILSLKTGNESWALKLLTAGGVGGVLLIALAQFASAAGNRFSDEFWPPKGGLPTGRWLRPSDVHHSTAQKQQWYAAVKLLTGLDIAETLTARPKEQDSIIEDAIRQVRYKLRGKAVARMLDLHNQEYGFARNLAGLRWVMLGFAALGAGGCAVAWQMGHGSAWGSLINGVLFVFAFSLFFWLPGYVERAGIRYSESFFSALLAVAGRVPQEKISSSKE
jgi:Flp pilus assembly protein TadB